jgi:diphosphomevalonate decarboxylase
VVESEALTLHAMMMTRCPILFDENQTPYKSSMRFEVYCDQTLFVLHSMQEPMHVLYPENDSAAVLQFIKDELAFAKIRAVHL